MSFTNTPMQASSTGVVADAAAGGVRLTLPVRAGGHVQEVTIEPAHCERLFRMAAYRAIRDGTIAPERQIAARMASGRVCARHGSVACLETCVVELLDTGGRVLARHEFPRATWAAFAAARGLHLQVSGQKALDASAITYSLHAAECGDAPFPVDIPALFPLSVDELVASSFVEGSPIESWVATFVSLQVADGLQELGRLSSASGLETAGRIHARVGFDPDRRRFVRILDRLVVSRATEATASTVLSTGASWGEFLASTEGVGAQAYASAHTHLHLNQSTTNGTGAGSESTEEQANEAAEEPILSIDDMVTHYTAFPDPLSAALIVSLFPRRWLVTLYGYETDGRLVREPGYWVLRE